MSTKYPTTQGDWALRDEHFSLTLHPWGTRDPRPMILAISRVSGRHPWPNPWHGETGVYPTGTREKDALSGRLTGLKLPLFLRYRLPININNDEWILILVCFLVIYNHTIIFMNIKTANIETFGNRIRKLGKMYVLLRNCRVHITDPWIDPAPAKIDTGVGYIPTNQPAKTKARVARTRNPTNHGFFSRVQRPE